LLLWTSAKKAQVKKTLVVALIAFALLWVVGCGTIYWKMSQPPETFASFMAHLPGPVAFLAFPFETMWTRARGGHLRLGDPAPDFSLIKLDRSGSVQLSELTARRRPVILIFGSYT
jgi:hypothetical protein